MKQFLIVWSDSMGQREVLETFTRLTDAQKWIECNPLLFCHIEETE